jgi:hypothetical protein
VRPGAQEACAKEEEDRDVDYEGANFGKENPEVMEVESVMLVGLVYPALQFLSVG